MSEPAYAAFPEAFKPGDMLRFKTDDLDISSAELCIMQGGNGDWYVSVANGPDHFPREAVRICTSGGAASRCPGLGSAIGNAYTAMLASKEGKTPEFINNGILGLCGGGSPATGADQEDPPASRDWG